MTGDMKKRCREIVEKDGWNRIGIIEDDPDVLLWNKTGAIELLYENMDGKPCICIATYIKELGCDGWYRGESMPVTNARMCYLIAWRKAGTAHDREKTEKQSISKHCGTCSYHGGRIYTCDNLHSVFYGEYMHDIDFCEEWEQRR